MVELSHRCARLSQLAFSTLHLSCLGMQPALNALSLHGCTQIYLPDTQVAVCRFSLLDTLPGIVHVHVCWQFRGACPGDPGQVTLVSQLAHLQHGDKRVLPVGVGVSKDESSIVPSVA